jgi:hypothetical protein
MTGQTPLFTIGTVPGTPVTAAAEGGKSLPPPLFEAIAALPRHWDLSGRHVPPPSFSKAIAALPRHWDLNGPHGPPSSLL